MPYLFISCFENTLLPSILAAAAIGPKEEIPSAARRSQSPMTSGSSGVTNTRDTFLFFAAATIPSRSVAFTGTHSAISEMPPLPGAQYSLPHFSLFLSAAQTACSLPPPPTTSMSSFSIAFILLLFIYIYNWGSAPNPA
ncbi:hypothetical protein SDC9_206474 [bioreactor metagenome]|uniref:Uncharacterized protein n=1 Tax=bioreactor metagenome TaxID=1076179 RepID=A0A645J562_9ZZZZ